MSPTIELEDDVFEALKRHAEPFIDTPSDVVRRLLAAAAVAPAAALGPPTTVEVSPAPANGVRMQRAAGGGSGQRRKAAKRKRAPSDQLLPEEAYELPILRVLEAAGGRLPTSEAITAVEPLVLDRLMPMDRDMLDSGKSRWESRVVFTRLRLIKSGLLKSDSPRGVWEISDAGRRRLAAEAVTA
jgi:hypothetical protein